MQLMVKNTSKSSKKIKDFNDNLHILEPNEEITLGEYSESHDKNIVKLLKKGLDVYIK